MTLEGDLFLGLCLFNFPIRIDMNLIRNTP